MIHPFLYITAAAILIITGARATRAHGHRHDAQTALAAVTQQAAELSRLRREARTTSLPPRPDAALAGKVSQALTRAGIPLTVMQSLSPEAETSNKGIVRAHATLTLTGLTLPNVGKFLESWRTSEPDWIISNLDLSPSGTGTPGADLPLRAVVTFDAFFKEQPQMPTDPRSGGPR